MSVVSLLRRIFIAVLLVWGCIATAQDAAQTGDGDPVYPFWENVAENAEATIYGDDNSTVDDLEVLRARLVAFRNEFSNQRGANSERISSLRSQVEALGPVPEQGTEAEEIANTRSQLQAELEQFQAPVRVADAAFQRADGLISEIDRILRERQTRRLLSLGPSPVDPRNWPEAAQDIVGIAKLLAPNAAQNTQESTSRFGDRLPLVIFLIAVSLTFVVRGRRWAARAVDYMRRFGGRGSGVWSFLVSLLRVFLPLTGLYIFAYAIRLADVVNPLVEQFLIMLPVWGLGLLGFNWLADQLFGRRNAEVIITLEGDRGRSARFFILALSVLFVLRGVVDLLFNAEGALPETIAVLAFPIVVMMGFVLICIGVLLRRAINPEESDEDDAQKQKIGLPRILRICGGFMIVVGSVAPVMSAIGYAEAGNALLFPTTWSFLLFGLVIVLQRFFIDVFGLISGQGLAARDGLVAILISFVLVLAALPITALIWGARVTDLTELWTTFLQGFDIGGTQISPSNFLTFVTVFAMGYGITRLLQGTLRQSVLPKTRIDVGGQNALVSGTGYVGIFLAALVAVTVAGLDLSGLAIVAGALSVGIGFGLQTIVSNFVSGIILLVERPISEGDWIEVGGQMGYVKQISVRATRIETFDRTDVIVPNSDLVSGTVTNYTRGNTIGRLIVSVGVAYGTDTKRVDAILREIAEAQPMVLRHPPPSVVLMGFGADSLDFEIRVILRDVNWMLSVKNDINHAIAERFTAEGIEIPFAQRDVWLRNPEALQASSAPDTVVPKERGET